MFVALWECRARGGSAVVCCAARIRAFRTRARESGRAICMSRMQTERAAMGVATVVGLRVVRARRKVAATIAARVNPLPDAGERT